MYVIASNISTRYSEINRIFVKLKENGWKPEGGAAQELKHTAAQCIQAGADAIEINLQQHDDTPQAMDCAVRIIQQVTDRPLCLSTHKAEVLEAGLKACKQPPIVNYISIDEKQLKEMFPLVVKNQAKVIFLVSDPAHPSDARDMLEKAAILVGAANAAGITNDRIMIDPGIIHIPLDIGQSHLKEVRDFLKALPDTFEPPVMSAAWLSNASSGASAHVRPMIETGLLTTLAGWGLSAVFMNVLDIDNIRALNLVRVFNNDCVYAEALIDLRA